MRNSFDLVKKTEFCWREGVHSRLKQVFGSLFIFYEAPYAKCSLAAVLGSWHKQC